MASGSIPAIHFMFKILEAQLRDETSITVDHVRRQFELEYGISITPNTLRAAEPFTPPTAQELDEERSYLLQRHASVGKSPIEHIPSGEFTGKLIELLHIF